MPDKIAGSIVVLIIATDAIVMEFALILLILLEMLATFDMINPYIYSRTKGSKSAASF